MIDIFNYLCFEGVERSWTLKVEYLLKIPSQREAYRKMTSVGDKADFFINHFIMNDLASRQLDLAVSSKPGFSQEFVTTIDHLIDLLDNSHVTKTTVLEHRLSEVPEIIN